LGIIPSNVALPCFHGLFTNAEAGVDFTVDGCGFGEDSVHILMESLQEVAKELLTVLLVVPAEPRRESVDSPLETAGVHDPPPLLPEALDHRGEGLDQGALHGGVGGVDFPHVLVIQQVVGQLPGVGQALEDRVHEASVANVPEATRPFCTLPSLFHRTFFFRETVAMTGG